MVDVFSSKLWWSLRENKSIQVTFMHEKYVKANHPLLVMVDKPSVVWHRLVGIRELAQGNIQWFLGEELVDFWHDKWCIDIPLSRLVSRSDKPHLLVGELYKSNGWDDHHLQQLLPSHIVAQILKLRIFPRIG